MSYDRAVERFPIIRQSRLATFDRCALSSWFEENYESGWSSKEQARGTIFHRFAAKYLSECYRQQERSMPGDAAVAILDECLRQHDIDQRCPDCPAPIARRYQSQEGFPRIVCENGHDHASEWVNVPFEEIKDLRWVVVKFANDNAFDIEYLVDVEQRLKATLTYPGGERVLTGQLDALFTNALDEDEFIVLDWKDTWGIPGPSELGFDGYFQQRFYAWLVFKNFPSAKRVTTKEFYVRFSDSREATVYREDMDDVEAELSALLERYDRAWHEEVFPPTPGVHCHFCARPSACPIFPGVRGVGMIEDDETAQRVARELTVAEAALKSRKGALSAYTGVRGPQEVSSHKGRKAWTHKPTKTVTRPTRDAMAAAIESARHGIPLDLDSLYKERTGSRFGLHTYVEPDDDAADAQLMNALEASVHDVSLRRSTDQGEAA
jgi:hypothetical protein